MSRIVKRRWTPSTSSGLSRRDRQGCDYEAYIPDTVHQRRFLLDGSVAADVADAEAAIVRLDATASVLANTETLARLLLRAESVASSRIEGLIVGGRRLLRAELGRALGAGSADALAEEVLGNIDAMTIAVDLIAGKPQLTVDDICTIHQRLLGRTRLRDHAGNVRQEQNWIGGSSHNPCTAAFVPPPPSHVAVLMEDLVAFCNEDDLPSVVQAALAHSQFETIHPFVDGNGRTGRALIHVVLRRRGLARHTLPPISLVLATWARSYVEGLTATRYRGPATSAPAHDGINLWIGTFATACRRAAADAESFEHRIVAIQESWRSRLGRVRPDSATALLVDRLPGVPVVTVASAAQLVDRSTQATNEAVTRLVEARVLAQVNIGRRDRAFEASDVVAAFTDLERQLGSPEGDTLTSPPTRQVPQRRR